MKVFSGTSHFCILAVITTCFGISSCANTDDSSNNAFSGAPVSVVHPRRVAMTEYIQLTATTVFLSQEIVRSTVQGYVRKSFRKLGDAVKSGEPLFQLQTREASALAQTPNDTGKNRFTSAITINAASSGILSEVDHFEGDFVSEGDRIAVVANPSSMVILLHAPYQYTKYITKGVRCIIDIPGRTPAEGTVLRSIPSVDMTSQTQSYIIQCTETTLPENLNVAVKIPVRSVQNAVAVPKRAVLSNETQDEFWVMTMLDDSTAVKRDIRKGIENDSLVQVLDPVLTVRDEVVSDGGYGLPDTAHVAIQ